MLRCPCTISLEMYCFAAIQQQFLQGDQQKYIIIIKLLVYNTYPINVIPQYICSGFFFNVLGFFFAYFFSFAQEGECSLRTTQA